MKTLYSEYVLHQTISSNYLHFNPWKPYVLEGGLK